MYFKRSLALWGTMLALFGVFMLAGCGGGSSSGTSSQGESFLPSIDPTDPRILYAGLGANGTSMPPVTYKDGHTGQELSSDAANNLIKAAFKRGTSCQIGLRTSTAEDVPLRTYTLTGTKDASQMLFSVTDNNSVLITSFTYQKMDDGSGNVTYQCIRTFPGSFTSPGTTGTAVSDAASQIQQAEQNGGFTMEVGSQISMYDAAGRMAIDGLG